MGTIKKVGMGRTGSGKKKFALSYFFHQTSLVPPPLFRLTPLTESLEQATEILESVTGLTEVVYDK